MRLQVRDGFHRDPLIRARKEHFCSLCGGQIENGTLYYAWTTYEDGPMRSKAHALCMRAEVVEDGFEADWVGIDGDDLVDPDLGAEQWWELIKPYGPEGLEPQMWRYKEVQFSVCGEPDWVESATIWPPDLHGWLISLPQIEWNI